MCCIDSVACRFASFVGTVAYRVAPFYAAMAACAAGGRVGRRPTDRALLHGARLLDFKNWTQSQSCEVRRRCRRRNIATRRCSHPLCWEGKRTVGRVRQEE